MQERIQEAIQVGNKLFEQGSSMDDFLRFLRENNYSKITSMKVLMKIKGISLSEAKRIVHTSVAWNDLRERDDAFHDLLTQTLEEKSNSTDSTPFSN